MGLEAWLGRVLPVVIGSSLLASACSGSTDSGERSAYCPGEVIPSTSEGTCRTHADCGAGACLAPTSQSPLREESSFQIVVRPGADPAAPAPTCYLTPCVSSDVECPAGNVCETPDRVSLYDSFCYTNACVPACQCYADERCRPDGHCEVIPCSDPASRLCPTGWACMPGTGDPGSETVDSWASSAGCVRIACDLPGGILCEAGWTCDPSSTPAIGPAPPWGNTAGCAPISCAEGTTCTSDRICYPDGTDSIVGVPSGSLATREDGRTVDPYGCVTKNCEEGLQCSQFWECSVGHADAGVDGCRAMSCSESGGANCETLYQGTHWCQPGALGADVYGCAPEHCDQGFVCPTGFTCNSTHAAAGQDGCVDSRCVAQPTLCSGMFGTGGSGGGSGGTGGMATGQPCADDFECACGSCVLSVCAPRPGTCSAP